MINRSKILFALLVLALTMLIGLVVHPIFFEKKDSNDKTLSKSSRESASLVMENEYRAKIKIEFEKFYSYLTQSKNNIEKLESIRTGILALRVPTKYRDLHLKFVLAVDRMENFERLGKANDKKESERIINLLKAENKWL